MKSNKLHKLPNAVLLNAAVDLMFEIYLLRGDCSVAARSLSQRGGHEQAIEDCAQLDDTLAKAFRSLQKTLREIQESRARRSDRTR